MILVCPNCSARLQIDEEKAPARPFSVRCPKCANSISSSSVSPASEQSALAVGGDSPSTERRRFDYARTAPTFELESENEQYQAQPAADDAVKLLLDLLRKSSPNARAEGLQFNSWNRRKVLVCAPETYRETIARSLAENNYQVFVAEETRQAVETMRSNQLQVVILEGQFDQAEQGAAFVVREINVLRAAQRRRLFFVLLSASYRTMDAHAAFLSNVNAVVNVVDIEDLPRILEIGLREFNELYKDYYAALSLPAL